LRNAAFWSDHRSRSVADSWLVARWASMTRGHRSKKALSHLIGAALFLLLLCQFVSWHSSISDLRFPDIAAVSVYHLCVVVCFVLSTIFHTFSDHSPEMHRFGNELDHLGIVLVMWGTGTSGTYFIYYCDSAFRNAYLTLLSAVAYGCGVFTLRPKFRQPAYRTMRFLMYVFLGTSLFVPIFHGAYRYGWNRLEEMMALESYLGLAVINFSGAAVYAMRIPERWFPGKFDLIGMSHNWMHVLVLTGALVRLRGLLWAVTEWNRIPLEQTCSRIA
jgi:adiponectin receptor